MKLPPFAMLRAFEAAARAGGFSAAGRELNVTHAAVAQQVRALEALLDVPLAIREGRGLALTEEGRRLAGALTDSFRAVEVAIAGILEEEASRPIRVTMTPSFAAKWLMPRLGGFWRDHPEIALTLDPDTRVRDLTREGFDIAIRYGEGRWPGVETELLTRTDDVVVGTPGLLGGRERLSVAEMQEMPWIIESGWTEELAWLRSIGLDPDRLDMTEMPTEEMVSVAARAGLGLAVELGPLAAPDIADGTLTAVHVSRAEGSYGYWIATRPGPKKAALRTFIRWLRSVV